MTGKHCAPGKGDNISCFSNNSLKKIATKFNDKYGKRININDNKKKVWKQLRKELSKKCNNEWCWIEQDFIKNLRDDEIDNYTFKPKKPKGKYKWLNSLDIDDVMNQYEKIYPDFTFFGPVPIDFEEINTELTNFNLKKFISSNKNKFGVIYNLDPHYKSGSHWVSMFVHFNIKKKKCTIDFFDSVANPPSKEIKDFINKISEKTKNIGIKKVEININKRQHQFDDYECGVYSLNFIIQRLKGKLFNNITKNIILDEEMNKYRNKIFRPLIK